MRSMVGGNLSWFKEKGDGDGFREFELIEDSAGEERTGDGDLDVIR